MKNMKDTYRKEMRKYRFLNGEMTQDDLGRVMGLSRQSICDIENGRRMPTLKQAYKIAKLLNKSIEELFFIPEGE